MNCALGAVALYCPLGAVALGLARWALWRCGAVEWHYSATALNTALVGGHLFLASIGGELKDMVQLTQ